MKAASGNHGEDPRGHIAQRRQHEEGREGKRHGQRQHGFVVDDLVAGKRDKRLSRRLRHGAADGGREGELARAAARHDLDAPYALLRHETAKQARVKAGDGWNLKP